MGLLGTAAIAIFSNYPQSVLPEQSAFHSYEHLLERVSTPGFLRGRRVNAVTVGAPTVFALYEVADSAVAVSDAYVHKLNNPTPWTSAMLPRVNDATRTLCRVAATAGVGTGAHLAVARVTPSEDRAAAMYEWVAEELVPSLAGADTRVAAHFLVRAEGLTRPVTTEEKIRASGSGSTEQDWIIVTEGYSAEGAQETIEVGLSRQRLLDAGAEAAVVQQYRLAHIVAKDELDYAGLSD